MLNKIFFHEHLYLNLIIFICISTRHEWENSVPIEERIQIFLRAAEMISGEWRAQVLASTMLGQAKTVQQAEIDAAAELIDFYRFNAQVGGSAVDGRMGT